VAVLVYFLNHIPASIRINTVLRGIGSRLLRDIDEEYPEPHLGVDPQPAPKGAAVPARGTGYVQMIDFDDLEALAEKHGCVISLQVRVGDFVHQGMPLAELCDEEGSEEIERRLEDAFILGASRTPRQDPQFLMDELVEIGLRALSPGINDPFTAITALHWLGAATAKLGSRDLRKLAAREDEKRMIYPLPDNFEHFVERGFGAIRSAVATSPTAAVVMLDALRHAAGPLDDERRVARLAREGDRLFEQAGIALTGPSLQEVEARYALFQKAFA
jgi:uncharacterized membrane protein